MKRVIKFRCFDRSENRMIGWDGIVKHIKQAGEAIWFYFEDDQEMIMMQYTGIKDRNGKDIYEGDILKAYAIETEYQTHYGDNIPRGSYTEPCGVIAKNIVGQVVYHENRFTTNANSWDSEERHDDCIVSLRQFNRDDLEDIVLPRPYHRWEERASDDELLETVQDIANECGFLVASIEEFLAHINTAEVIGNIYENPELIPA